MPTKKPKHITFTGIDERTDLDRCARISSMWSVEWGVLIGGRLGKNRYPSDQVIQAAIGRGLSMSLHVCGQQARTANRGVLPDHAESFSRMQVNMASRAYDTRSLTLLAQRTGKTIIAQTRGEVFPHTSQGIQFLFDRSGGRGVPSTYWPPGPKDQTVGYAGGLNPDNVAAIVASIDADKFWIDMETGVRTDDWLDLDKCDAGP